MTRPISDKNLDFGKSNKAELRGIEFVTCSRASIVTHIHSSQASAIDERPIPASDFYWCAPVPPGESHTTGLGMADQSSPKGIYNGECVCILRDSYEKALMQDNDAGLII
jgi:hypothetical protein